MYIDIDIGVYGAVFKAYVPVQSPGASLGGSETSRPQHCRRRCASHPRWSEATRLRRQTSVVGLGIRDYRV